MKISKPFIFAVILFTSFTIVNASKKNKYEELSDKRCKHFFYNGKVILVCEGKASKALSKKLSVKKANPVKEFAEFLGLEVKNEVKVAGAKGLGTYSTCETETTETTVASSSETCDTSDYSDSYGSDETSDSYSPNYGGYDYGDAEPSPDQYCEDFPDDPMCPS